MYQFVRDEICVAAVTSVFQWKEDEGSLVNHDCSFDWVGRAFSPGGAGFTSKSDSGDKCTNLFRDMVSIHLQHLAAENWLEDVFKEHLASHSHHQCNPSTVEASSSQQLQVEDLGGIFGIMLVASLICCIGRIGWNLSRTTSLHQNFVKEIEQKAGKAGNMIGFEISKNFNTAPNASIAENALTLEKMQAFLVMLESNRDLLNQLAQTANRMHRASEQEDGIDIGIVNGTDSELECM
mmetsp:Transcript_7074/g.9572  ORF Transcript_7074/g.9572 Transcript_7074/m.9572 type:complete len:237 (+) Transcript_7074:3-713(+)